MIHEISTSNFCDNCPIFVVHTCCLKEADKHSSNEVRQPRFGIIDNFFSKKAKTLIIMINIANNSLVNNTQNNIPKFTLWGENMATLEDSGTLFGSLNLVLILDIGNKKM